MSSPFSKLPTPREDPIFTIGNIAARAGPEAINATIGFYLNEDGKLHLFESTKRALQTYGATLHERDMAYSPLLGLDGYRETVTNLLFGENHAYNVACIATTGGTAGLAFNLRLQRLIDPDTTLILPVPSWANHASLCRFADVTVHEVVYLDDGKPTATGIVEGMKQTKGSKALLLQASAHNPLGLDLNQEQWNMVIETASDTGTTLFIDIAYQGFTAEPTYESELLQRIATAGIPLLIAWSASKNHCMYGMRTGMALAVLATDEERVKVEGHYNMISRGMNSTAPTPGQWLVDHIQREHHEQWLKDLTEVRAMIEKKREVMKQNLPEPYASACNGHGMFAVLPLSEKQITKLRDEQKVYIVGDGRVNIAGIPFARVEEFCEKVERSLD